MLVTGGCEPGARIAGALLLQEQGQGSAGDFAAFLQ